MGDNFLRIEDLVEFRLATDELVQVQDDYAGAFKPVTPGEAHSSGMGTVSAGAQQRVADGLNVTIAATHAGIITRNNGFYLPDKMKKGASSFVEDFYKPVLLHHKKEEDGVGRIIASEYMDTSGSIQDRFKEAGEIIIADNFGQEKGRLTERRFQDFVDGKLPFGMAVDTVVSLFQDSILSDSGYSGLGYVQIVANITDKEAIQKLLDGRYLTGSVGASTNKAVCSVCRSDWTETGKCEHKPGAIYDGAKCFIIAGELIYDEYSFVNRPADRYSRVMQLHHNGAITDCECANDYQGRIYEAHLGFPQYDSVHEEDEGMSAKKEGVTPEVDINDATSTSETPESSEQKTEENPTQVADSAKDKQEESVEPNKEEVVEDKKTGDEDEVIKNEEEDVIKLLDKLIEKSDDFTTEDSEKLYDEMWGHIEKTVEDGVLSLDDLGVKELGEIKLDSAKVKRMAKSKFCGLGRYLPVPDAAHVVAAKVMLDAYEGETDVSKVQATLDRKAKVMGIADKLNVKAEKSEEAVTGKQVDDKMSHGRVMHALISTLEEAQHWSEEPVLADDEVKTFQGILKRLSAFVGKDAFASALLDTDLAIPKEAETALVDEVEKLEEANVTLKDQVKALRSEYYLTLEDMETLQDQLTTAHSDVRKFKEEKLNLFRTLKDGQKEEEVDFTSIQDAALDTELESLAKEVDISKIAAKLGDGMARNPTDSVEDPTAIQSDQKSSVIQLTDKQKADIDLQYSTLLFGRGKAVADQYIADLKFRGIIPFEDQVDGVTK